MDGVDGDMSPKAVTPRQEASAVATSIPRRINVHELLGGQREMVLVLQETEYRLRVTSKGKLILTK